MSRGGGKVIICPPTCKLHQRLLNSAVIEVVADEMREVAEAE